MWAKGLLCEHEDKVRSKVERSKTGSRMKSERSSPKIMGSSTWAAKNGRLLGEDQVSKH
ncbi:hypothetical protein M422DRAFT_275609 [Sphaerobolus stellatus SS14]|uniref:Uncharacterized protein n=1 Tax=Sphaerobolus stellatus (strain SS14) TaxID=990650 RepID=A0A0C9UE44_SPHS4|nr:hypothetical protein M422DRAFT_275609 [Sphaerobolus stellatus SS14]